MLLQLYLPFAYEERKNILQVEFMGFHYTL